jgi:hypothetical protein
MHAGYSRRVRQRECIEKFSRALSGRPRHATKPAARVNCAHGQYPSFKQRKPSMEDKEFVTAVARSLFWGYVKATTGTPIKWSELDQEGRKLWRGIAKRAIRKVDELRLQEVVVEE